MVASIVGIGVGVSVLGSSDSVGVGAAGVTSGTGVAVGAGEGTGVTTFGGVIGLVGTKWVLTFLIATAIQENFTSLAAGSANTMVKPCGVVLVTTYFSPGRVKVDSALFRPATVSAVPSTRAVMVMTGAVV